jgi:hypothetical protein
MRKSLGGDFAAIVPPQNPTCKIPFSAKKTTLSTHYSQKTYRPRVRHGRYEPDRPCCPYLVLIPTRRNKKAPDSAQRSFMRNRRRPGRTPKYIYKTLKTFRFEPKSKSSDDICHNQFECVFSVAFQDIASMTSYSNVQHSRKIYSVF